MGLKVSLQPEIPTKVKGFLFGFQVLIKEANVHPNNPPPSPASTEYYSKHKIPPMAALGLLMIA